MCRSKCNKGENLKAIYPYGHSNKFTSSSAWHRPSTRVRATHGWCICPYCISSCCMVPHTNNGTPLPITSHTEAVITQVTCTEYATPRSKIASSAANSVLSCAGSRLFFCRSTCVQLEQHLSDAHQELRLDSSSNATRSTSERSADQDHAHRSVRRWQKHC